MINAIRLLAFAGLILAASVRAAEPSWRDFKDGGLDHQKSQTRIASGSADRKVIRGIDGRMMDRTRATAVAARLILPLIFVCGGTTANGASEPSATELSWRGIPREPAGGPATFDVMSNQALQLFTYCRVLWSNAGEWYEHSSTLE